MLRWVLLISLLFLQTACDSANDVERPTSSLLNKPAEQAPESAKPAAAFEPLTATDLLNDPTPVHDFESTAEALTIWRRGAVEKPTLLLLSNNPHLIPVPEELRDSAAIMANTADLETLQLKSSDRSPSPLILPGMAIDLALQCGWFSELVWALPLKDPAQELSLGKFRTQLKDKGLINETESSSIKLDDKIFTAKIRETTLRAAALPLVKELKGPVILHIDLSYLQPLYKNEISTPLLDVLVHTLTTLQKMHLKTLAVTFSYGHQDNQMALDVRFLGEVFKYLIEGPARLRQDIPINWQRQRDALYLVNFFQNDKIRELYEAQEKDAPDKGWVKFNLYRFAAKNKEGTKALEYLAEAVRLDPMYAMEYLELANMAYEKKRPDEALRMLNLAAVVLHEDPFIQLQMAQLANELGQKEKALELLSKIRNLEWSKIYYPQMPQYLAGLTTFVQTGQVPGQAANSTDDLVEKSQKMAIPIVDLSRQKVMHSQNTRSK